MVARTAVAQQLVKFLNGAMSAEQLSSWALNAVVENDNAKPALPVAEHEVLEEVLTACALSEANGFALSTSEIKALLERLRSEPATTDAATHGG